MAKMKAGAIRVEGLRELNKSLRDLGPEARAELKAASQKVAELVAADARAAAMSLGGVAAKVAPSLSARSSVGGSAGVAFGGPRFPMAGGAEFGAGRERMRDRTTGQYVGYRQFQDWKGNGPGAGYFLYPTIRRDADRIVTEFTTALEDLVQRVGLA
jgi:hypothetical protein